jgi:hypothetical protein
MVRLVAHGLLHAFLSALYRAGAELEQALCEALRSKLDADLSTPAMAAAGEGD